MLPALHLIARHTKDNRTRHKEQAAEDQARADTRQQERPLHAATAAHAHAARVHLHAESNRTLLAGLAAAAVIAAATATALGPPLVANLLDRRARAV